MKGKKVVIQLLTHREPIPPSASRKILSLQVGTGQREVHASRGITTLKLMTECFQRLGLHASASGSAAWHCDLLDYQQIVQRDHR